MEDVRIKTSENTKERSLALLFKEMFVDEQLCCFKEEILMNNVHIQQGKSKDPFDYYFHRHIQFLSNLHSSTFCKALADDFLCLQGYFNRQAYSIF